jgi:hypothetical protein
LQHPEAGGGDPRPEPGKLQAHIGGRGVLNRYLTRPKYANLLP